MKKVLLSVNPKWVAKICNKIGERDGKPIYEKRVEVRKTKPKAKTPFTVLIYETMGRTETPFVDEEGHHIFKGRGQVIGEFVCDRIYDLRYLPNEYYGKPSGTFEEFICESSCLSFDDIKAYGNGKNILGWHISDLVIYDKPRELSEFWTIKCTNKKGACGECKAKPNCIKPITRPPQSWLYVEDREWT